MTKRKHYETPEMLQKENMAREFLASELGWQIHKLSYVYAADWLVIRKDKPVLLTEFKKRNIKLGMFGGVDGVFLSIQKASRMNSIATPMAWRTAMIVENDHGFWLNIFDIVMIDTWRVEGRTKKTRDEADIEPVLLLPREDFKLVYRKEGGPHGQEE